MIEAHVWERVRYYSRAQKALEFLDWHMHEPFTLEEAASYVCMERTAFSRFFSRRIGLPFMDFVRLYRVERAIELMRKSDKPIAEISRNLGYDNVVSFVRMFRSITGLSPALYRRQTIGLLVLDGQNSDMPRTATNLQISVLSAHNGS